MFSILDEGMLSHNPGTGAFIPSVTPLNDGTFIAAQQVGSSHPESRVLGDWVARGRPEKLQ